MVFDDLGKEVVYVGFVGVGMELKFVLNFVMGFELQVLAEVVVAGVVRGFDRVHVLRVIVGSGFVFLVMRFKVEWMIEGRYGDPDFCLCLMAKDFDLVVDGFDFLMIGVVWDMHACVVTVGFGDFDCVVIVSCFDRLSV